jgi:hypothetical protein
MSKVGTLEHKKTKKLAKILKSPSYSALGLLEAFWHWVGKYCPNGLLEIDDFEACADTIGYKGRHEKDLCKILLECRLIEPFDDKMYVHDWHDHAPDYVKKALNRTGRNFANGSPPYGVTTAGQRHDDGGTDSGQGRDNITPTKTRQDKTRQDQPRYDATGVVPLVSDLEIFMSQRKRKNPKQDAEDCWNFYAAQNWRTAKDEPIGNWRTFAGYWIDKNPEPETLPGVNRDWEEPT